MSTRALLLAGARRLLKPLGIDLVRHDPTRAPGWRRQQFFRQLEVELVLDIGANAGQYVREIRQAGFVGDVISFEPLSTPFTTLQAAAATDAHWRCHNLALGDHPGQIEVNVSANSYSSSVLQMTSAHLESAPDSAYRGLERVRLARLDALSLPIKRTFLKIDVQGYERQVLAGAVGLMPQVLGIELELSLVELYEGQALLEELVASCRQLGFQLASLETGFSDPRTLRVLQVDGIFLRN